MQSWFHQTRISKNLTHINDNGNDAIYLVSGKKWSVLIDTGLGFFDLYAYIKDKTPLPITVFNTHGHLDHCSGNYFFDTIYIHPDDKSMATSRFIPSTIDFIFRTFKNVPPKDMFDYEKWIMRTRNVIDIEEKPYDFKDFIVHPIFTPGHTSGSICYYIEPYNYLFTGDNVVHGPTWLQLPESVDLETFKKSIQKLFPFINDETLIFSGHSKRPIAPTIVQHLPRFLEQVLNREVDSVPRKTLMGNTFHYKMENNYGVLIKS